MSISGIFWNRQSDVPEEPEDVRSIREHFSHPLSFVISMVACCVGLGNILRFPYLCYKNGGATFIVCYMLSSLTVGVPYLFLELSLGQFMQSGMLRVWQMCPLFKGVGWAMFVLSFYETVYYNVVLAWALLYLFMSLHAELPWKNCNNEWNTVNCVPASCKSEECYNISTKQAVSSAKEYWDRRILQITDGIENLGTLQWEIAGTLLIMWILCYFSLWRGLKFLSKVIFLTVSIPYVILFILLMRAFLLQGAVEGLKYYLNPDPSKFLDVQVWYEAVSHVLYSLRLGYGIHVAFGSYNDYHNNIYWQSLVIALVDFLSSLLIGLLVFCIIGFMSDVQKKPISELFKDGAELAFIVYPTVALELPDSTLWAIILFFVIAMIGFDTQLLVLQSFLTAVQDEYHYWIVQKTKIFDLLVCFAHFALGLIYTTQGGMYVFQITETYGVAGWSVFFLMLLEGSAIAYVYGINKFYLNLEDMFGFRPSWCWKICWLVISPLTLFVLIIGIILQQESPTYGKYEYPMWVHVLGWLWSASSIAIVPLYMLYYIASSKGTLRQRFKKSIKPSYELSTSSQTSETRVTLRNRMLNLTVGQLPVPIVFSQRDQT